MRRYLVPFCVGLALGTAAAVLNLEAVYRLQVRWVNSDLPQPKVTR